MTTNTHIALTFPPLDFLAYVFMAGAMLELGRRAAQTLMRALGCRTTSDIAEPEQQRHYAALNPTPEYCVVALGGDAQRQERTISDSFNASAR